MSHHGHCIFCGNWRKITKEHILPRWLRRTAIAERLPSKNSSFKRMGSQTHPGAPPVYATYNKTSGGSFLTRTAAVACGQCNSGWMSDSDNVTKPILLDLIFGHARSLSLDDQKSLAAWVCLKSIVNAYYGLRFGKSPTVQDYIAVAVTDRRYLMERRLAPENWAINISHITGQRWQARWFRYSLHVSSVQSDSGEWVPVFGNGDEPSNCQATTFGIGQFLFHSLRWGDEHLKITAPSDGSGANRIWPQSTSALSWPLVPSITDDMADEIATALYKTARRSNPHLTPLLDSPN